DYRRRRRTMAAARVGRDNQNLRNPGSKHNSVGGWQLAVGSKSSFLFAAHCQLPAANCFSHLALQLLNLNQMLRIEGQAWIIAVRLVRAETTVGGLFATCLHRGGKPQLLEIPIVIAQVSDRLKILAG